MEKAYNEELYTLCHSPNIVWVIKYRTLKWPGYVAGMEGGKGAFKIFRVILRERDLEEGQSVVERTILE